MDWLATFGETRARILRLVRAHPRSINDLAASLGITDNAVRTHVASLERDGMVRQAGTQRSTGGKPARLYELTPQAEELFPKAYALVFTELVRMLKEEDGHAAANDRLRRVGRRLAAGSGMDGPPGERVEAAAALLESIGGSVDVVEQAEGWIIEARGCPLSAVVAADPDVCVLAESLVREVTGLEVTERCERSGRPRCAFRVRSNGSGPPSRASTP